MSAGERRAARIAAPKAVIAIAEAHPGIPLPDISTYTSVGVSWYLRGEDSARQMATLAEALPCELTGDIDPHNGERYRLAGILDAGPLGHDSLAVEVTAPAELVAEYTVTGTEVIEKRQWTLKPVEPQAAEGEARS